MVATVVLAVCATIVSAEGLALHGRVSDSEGLALPGVLVSVRPTIGGRTSTTVTDAGGLFTLALPPGSYRLRAELSGFEAGEQTLSIGPDEPSDLEIVLRMAAFHEQVTVKGEAPQAVLGEPHPDAPATVTREVVESGMLPNSQYDDLLPLLPNVVRGPDGLISVAGAAAPQGALRVNGFNMTDPISGEAATLLPLEAIESVDVYSGGYPADAGRATGGVTSVHTRSGGDHWDVTANSFFPRLRFAGGRPAGVDSWEPNVGASGPIVRGRLFIEEAVSYRFDRNRFDTLAGPQENTYAAFMAWSQVDAQVSPSHHLVFSAATDPQRTDRANITAFTTVNSVPRIERGGWSVSLGDRWTLGERSTLEVTLGRVRAKQSVTPLGAEPYDVGPDRIAGSYFDRQDLRGTRTEVAGVWSWTVRSGHLLRVGGSAGQLSLDGAEQAGVVNLIRTDDSTSRRITFLAADAVGFSSSATEAGVFAQDLWTVSPRLTVDAGVRYDRTTSVRAAVSPRVAWTLALSGSGDSTLSGSIGRFADKIPLAALAFPLMSSRLVQTWDQAGTSEMVRLFTNALGGALDTPVATRWDVELNHRFAGGWQARVKYQERRGERELVIDPQVVSATRGVLALQSTGTSRARSVEGTLAWRATGAGHEVYVSYVRAAAEGHVNTLERIGGALREPFVQPDQVAPIRADVPNRLLAWGVLHLPARVTLAPFVEVRDGFPWSPVDDEWRYAGAANSARLPWFGSLDLYVNKVFTISNRLPDARIGLKLYNVLSIHTERDVQRDTARPDFGSTYNPIPRDFTMVFELLWNRK